MKVGPEVKVKTSKISIDLRNDIWKKATEKGQMKVKCVVTVLNAYHYSNEISVELKVSLMLNKTQNENLMTFIENKVEKNSGIFIKSELIFSVLPLCLFLQQFIS